MSCACQPRPRRGWPRQRASACSSCAHARRAAAGATRRTIKPTKSQRGGRKTHGSGSGGPRRERGKKSDKTDNDKKKGKGCSRGKKRSSIVSHTECKRMGRRRPSRDGNKKRNAQKRKAQKQRETHGSSAVPVQVGQRPRPLLRRHPQQLQGAAVAAVEVAWPGPRPRRRRTRRRRPRPGWPGTLRPRASARPRQACRSCSRRRRASLPRFPQALRARSRRARAS